MTIQIRIYITCDLRNLGGDGCRSVSKLVESKTDKGKRVQQTVIYDLIHPQHINAATDAKNSGICKQGWHRI